MHYAVQHHIAQYDFLTTTPRRQVIKHRLIRVLEGMMLVRLGKNEYAVKPGESIWIPLDCLNSLTFFPYSRVQSIDFSSRLDLKFPKKSGQITPDTLLASLLDQLAQDERSPEDAYQEALLTLVKFEAVNLAPALKLDGFSRLISSWQPLESTTLDAQIQIALLVREAKKRSMSGQKKALIVEQLFAGSENECDQVAALILGQPL
ncbi:hypothetical protein [Vibrio genomosp. F10]|uniref:hypothetical protein n=1 Tax=Vibrio genomosp. F10 TaxID=723171 RepID=UPI0002E1C5E5|nr:hypothetical protein [Vibrio genomosp. F10]OEE93378.1 hypothetical protein A1QK_02935 [Vibrio genomosp. F10 str. 9ZD137]OEF07497.1 hypothetical protein A1QI_17255 [Vibrio genomosp. F10 str. 9ZB36]